MKKLYTLLIFLVFSLTLSTQNLGLNEELFLRDPLPRFNGTQVQQLQRFLLSEGMDIGPDGIDGWFGKDTEKALKTYQDTNGLAVTGRIRIADIPKEISLSPSVSVFTGSLEIPAPEILPFQQKLEISNVYGTMEVITENEHGEYYYDLIPSPNGRFIVGAFTYPQAENSLPIGVWDALSKTHLMLWPFDLLKAANVPAYNVSDNQFNYDRIPHIMGYYWDSLNSLYVVIEDDVDDAIILKVEL